MTLLLVHGAGCTPEVFDAQRAAFPEAHAIALPGHGVPGGCASVEAFADAVASYVEQRELRDVVLCGHSMGGAIGLELSVRKPPWLRGLVAIGSGARLRVGPQILAGLATDFPATSRLIASLLFADPTPAQLSAIEAMIDRVGQRRTLDDFVACNAFDATDRLESIALPLLAIVGERDGMTPPKYSQFLADRVPGGQVRILTGAGHLAMLEQPAQTNAELRAFVASLS